MDDLRRLQRALGDIAADGPALVIVENLADQWVTVSQRDVGVDTGQLRARINVTAITGSGVAGTADIQADTPYAGYHEYGNRYTAPNPYFRNGRDAAVREADKYGAKLETQLRRALDSGGVWNPRNL